MSEDFIERVKARLAADPPIHHWHVGLLSDMRAGKDVTIEAIAAIESLERLLFEAETAFAQLAAMQSDPIPVYASRDATDDVLGEK